MGIFKSISKGAKKAAKSIKHKAQKKAKKISKGAKRVSRRFKENPRKEIARAAADFSKHAKVENKIAKLAPKGVARRTVKRAVGSVNPLGAATNVADVVSGKKTLSEAAIDHIGGNKKVAVEGALDLARAAHKKRTRKKRKSKK